MGVPEGRKGQDRVRGLTRPGLGGLDNFSGSVGAAPSCLMPDPGPVRKGKGLVSQQCSSPDKAGGLGGLQVKLCSPASSSLSLETS